TSCNILHSFGKNCTSQYRRSCGSISSLLICLVSHILNKPKEFKYVTLYTQIQLQIPRSIFLVYIVSYLAPKFSNLSSSTILLATVTPSLVILGLPNDCSI